MMQFVRILLASINFAYRYLIVNKFRTLLTLSGISIGIFCIISVFSMVDSIKKNIDESIASLGDNVLFIQKWPWAFESDYAWWKYWKRPIPQLNELNELQRRSITAEYIAFLSHSHQSVEYMDVRIDDISYTGASEHYNMVMNFDLHEGRYISDNEFFSGVPVCIVGYKIAKELFFDDEYIGKEIRVLNNRLTVIGVFKEEGTGFGANSKDDMILAPIHFYRRHIDIRNESSNHSFIAIKVKPNISNEQAIDELTGIMRSIRRLKPDAEDNFSINQTSLLTKGLQGLFSVVNIAGWLIGSFSLLVGGFGIANIMFVSVKERTRIIGVQKAVGAKNIFILFQYITEAVFLSIIGGVIGLICVALLTFGISQVSDFLFYVSLSNIITALLISTFIGIISGLAPAYVASRLDPVIAIRQ